MPAVLRRNLLIISGPEFYCCHSHSNIFFFSTNFQDLSFIPIGFIHLFVFPLNNWLLKEKKVKNFILPSLFQCIFSFSCSMLFLKIKRGIDAAVYSCLFYQIKWRNWNTYLSQCILSKIANKQGRTTTWTKNKTITWAYGLDQRPSFDLQSSQDFLLLNH